MFSAAVKKLTRAGTIWSYFPKWISPVQVYIWLNLCTHSLLGREGKKDREREKNKTRMRARPIFSELASSFFTRILMHQEGEEKTKTPKKCLTQLYIYEVRITIILWKLITGIKLVSITCKCLLLALRGKCCNPFYSELENHKVQGSAFDKEDRHESFLHD